jgi:hypothetical protein
MVPPVVLANNMYEISNLARLKGGLGALQSVARSQAHDLRRRDHNREARNHREMNEFELKSGLISVVFIFIYLFVCLFVC